MNTSGENIDAIVPLGWSLPANPATPGREPAAAERERLLVQWNNTATAYPRDHSIHQLFEQQARLTPNAIALIFGREELTYGQLNVRANRLANYLRNLGVGPEVMVGICQERCLEMVVGLLAILKAGGAYVPLDPSYPTARLTFMIEDTRAQVVVTSRAQRGRLTSLRQKIRIVCADESAESAGDAAAIALESDQTPESGVTPDNLAYVMYTSGSTGQPKGVMVPHRGVVRLVQDTNYCRFGSDEVFLQLAPISFDASTLEIWGPLLNGGRLAVMPPETPSLDDLARAIGQYGVTTLWLTAGLFHLMVEQRVEALRPLDQLLAGGDVLSPPDVSKALAMLGPKGRLINGYGPTESTTFACCHVIQAGDRVADPVPIGRPISNTQVYLVDEYLQPVPVGAPGELCIGGDGLARGYLNQPDITAQKFVPNPFSNEPGARLYRTGDRARYLADGTIEFLGRMDSQVKILGHRVEPGEVEAELGRHPGVRQAAVIAWGDQPGEKRLVAYVTSSGQSANFASELREFLRSRLPDYMVPSSFVMVDALPLTPNGKVNRAALPAWRGAGTDNNGSSMPRTVIEQRICEVWRRVLGTDRVGVEDNFFDAGGDSLQLIEVHSELEKVLSVKISITDLFSYTTIDALARHLADKTTEGLPFADMQERARKQKEAMARRRPLKLGWLP
jgi:amino acid adenylation domain-containing protein